jgi:hypothetical protein
LARRRGRKWAVVRVTLLLLLELVKLELLRMQWMVRTPVIARRRRRRE